LRKKVKDTEPKKSKYLQGWEKRALLGSAFFVEAPDYFAGSDFSIEVGLTE